jgi:hypothetical protein
MSLLEVVIALAGACSTAMVVAAMVLLTPSGTESSEAESPSSADARPHPATSGLPGPAAGVARTSAHPPAVGDGAMT